MDIDYTDSKPRATGYTANLLAVKPAIGFNLSSDTRVNLIYKFENLDVTAVGLSEVLKQDLGQSTRSLIDLSFRHDKRDSIIKPTKGYMIKLGSEMVLEEMSSLLKLRQAEKYTKVYMEIILFFLLN